MFVIVGQGHAAPEAVNVLPCPQGKVRMTHLIVLQNLVVISPS